MKKVWGIIRDVIGIVGGLLAIYDFFFNDMEITITITRSVTRSVMQLF